jgi:hypothetical protein
MPTSETGTGEKPKPRSLRGILAILGILIGLLVLFGLSKEHQAPKEPGASSVKTDPSIRSGDTVYSSGKSLVGCGSDEDTYTLISLLKQSDTKAIDAMLLRGRCRELSAVDPLYVEKTPFSDNVCVRPRGEVDCLWANRAWLTKQRPVDATAAHAQVCAEMGFLLGKACDFAKDLSARSCVTSAGCDRAETTIKQLAQVCKNDAACDAAMQMLSCTTDASCREAYARFDQLAKACETKTGCDAAVAVPR